jgi:hypothetical protein
MAEDQRLRVCREMAQAHGRQMLPGADGAT